MREFLKGTGLSEARIDRISYLVGHHHTFSNIDGMDYQILVEGDFIANASENGYSEVSIRNALDRIIKTESGKRHVREVLCIRPEEEGRADVGRN